MTDRNVLSEEEIDALLTGVDSGDVDTGDEQIADADVRGYDLTSQDKIVRGRLPTLEMIGEKFARQFRLDLQQLLRYPVDVGAGGVQVLKFSEYVQSLFVPTSLTLAKISPFMGACLIVMDAKLVYRLVDRLFGGAGHNVEGDARDFTPTEQRVIGRIQQALAKVYEHAWSEVLDVSVQPIGREINPGLLNQFAADDVMMVSTFRLEMSSGGGELHIAIPYESLEPFKSVLDSRLRVDGDEVDRSWNQRLEMGLLQTDVALRCEVAAKRVALKELLNLRVGDVIEIDMPELHLVEVNQVPIFQGKLVESRGNLAFEYVQDVSV